MRRLFRSGLAAWLGLATTALVVGGTAAAAPPTECTADLTIFSTSQGTVRASGQVTHFEDSGVAGSYTSGFVAGYTFTGSQDISVNNQTQQSQLRGSFTATGPEGTFTVRYTGHADLTTGAATGHFEAVGGTGKFAGFHWAGPIAAQLVSQTPPTFQATDSGRCTFR